jgi:hypothetical protein
MEFVANGINGAYLGDYLPDETESNEIDYVLAAIAYGGSFPNESSDLVGSCVEHKLRLDLWMRDDHTVPVSLPLLHRLLKHYKDNIFTNFIPDCFHPKVIWWKGYGAYIGSANHTKRAWEANIEVGVFVTDEELIDSGMDIQLDQFFDYLKDCDKAKPISSEYISEMEAFNRLNESNFKAAKAARTQEEWRGPDRREEKTAFSRQRERFKTEWNSTLGYLQSIQSLLPDFRPDWIAADVPTAWEVDQFLHAYYYNQVGEGRQKPYEEYYSRHKQDPNSELRVQLEWWGSLKQAPSNEDVTFYESAPLLQTLLAKDKVLTLDAVEFAQVCSSTHATLVHLIKVPMSVMGRPNETSMSREQRIPLFAELIMQKRNVKGWDIRQLLHYVLYEGDDALIWERLFNAGRNSSYTISRYGLNSLSEVIGWARPEVAPPRNGRTSKALRALGFCVKIY